MRYHRLLGIAVLAVLAFAGCAEGTMGDGPVCGDEDCNGDETRTTCPQDCAPAQSAVCGDGTCNGTETATSCAQDCGGSTATCGDGTCNGSENATSCAQDCGGTASCGDSVCNGGETSSTCPVDCPATATCGDAICGAGEDVSCPTDCSGGGGAGCGDLVCDVAGGECTSADFNCVLDCIFDDVCGGGGGGGGGTCDHDVCTTGTALDGSCGTCEQEMCDYDDWCCTTEWDSFCVDQVNTVCSTQTCP